ncbi:hypothetical protein NLG97_g889 [Lecanicillium saksenae]|uniref:Uncharacterized protein n=1 Tax=Lecanicillium saksenae TaxID=468837 RepID=A0ACC1R5B5_9HYPO|nr:hypothetical protein NLG97_g889 [Lecanicillium saksenae]
MVKLALPMSGGGARRVPSQIWPAARSGLDAGATPRDIVFVRHYIVTSTGDAALDAMDVVERGWGDLWTAYLDKEAAGHRPPDTVLGVAALAKKELWYEVEVCAIVH